MAAPLPIDPQLPGIIAALREHRSLVLTAPPGAGKTTRVPPALLASGLLSEEAPQVVLLQPRRVAAQAAAWRIAQEQGWSMGKEVGYQVRLERRIGPGTRLQVLTEGVLTRRLLADPTLEQVGAVILDEFHERSIHSDLALAMLQEVRTSLREDLLLIVMSATLDVEPLARFLVGAPVVHVEGRTFPVDIDYLPSHAHEPPAERVVRALRQVLADPIATGDVLVFLPGQDEIRRTARLAGPLASSVGAQVMPLHGRLSLDEQRRVLESSAARKIILATNVAETSLTIEGVNTVIDSGLVRVMQLDRATGVERLRTRRISRASAAQRAGRAGRTSPGRCLRLWSARDERGMPESDEPEVHRIDLGPTLLALHAWGASEPSRFGWFDPPSQDLIEAAERVLVDLGALTGRPPRLTPLGRRLSDLPLPPRLGRLLVAAADAGLPRAGAGLAAVLSERDFVREAPGEPGRIAIAPAGPSDVLDRLARLEDAERRGFPAALRAEGIDPHAARRVAAVRDDLLRALRRAGQAGAPHEPGTDRADIVLGQLVLLAFPDRVCRRREAGSQRGLMVGGRGVCLHAASVVREAPLFVAVYPMEQAGSVDLIVRLASAVELDWLDRFFPADIETERVVRYDARRERVVTMRVRRFRDLIVAEDPIGTVAGPEAARALADGLRAEAASIVRRDEAATAWLDRLAFLQACRPDLALPAFDEQALAELLEAACQGCVTRAEVEACPKVPLLRTRLSHAQEQAIATLAPEALTVPSGSRIRLRYEPGRPPVLAVRVQELFGLAETPRVAGGRVPVLLELLGPNYRPVQITADLASFWKNTYPQVRKDLRARYPKHPWPEDPAAAAPIAVGTRRRPG